MRGDTTDNLSIAHLIPTKLIYYQLTLQKSKSFFPHHNSTFLAVAFLKVIQEITCKRPALNDFFLQVLAILSSLIPFSSRNPWFSLNYKSPHSTKCHFNSMLTHVLTLLFQRTREEALISLGGN